jgi:Flp pilus assembly protein TadB
MKMYPMFDSKAAARQAISTKRIHTADEALALIRMLGVSDEMMREMTEEVEDMKRRQDSYRINHWNLGSLPAQVFATGVHNMTPHAADWHGPTLVSVGPTFAVGLTGLGIYILPVAVNARRVRFPDGVEMTTDVAIL